MTKPAFCLENDESRAELNDLAKSLDAASLACPVGEKLTVATSLCHLAFWDQRAINQLRRWQRTGEVNALGLDSNTVDSINDALNVIAAEVPGEAVVALAVKSAAEVDALIEGLDQAMIDSIGQAGLERYLRRSIHRREHLRSIRSALDARRANPA